MCNVLSARPNIQPPSNPPDNGKVSLLWAFGFALLYLITILWVINGFFGNIIFYPLVFLTVVVLYQCGYKRSARLRKINTQLTRRTDLFRAFAQSFFSAGMLALMIELVISMIILRIFGVSDSRLERDLVNGDEDLKNDKSDFGAHVYYFLQAFLVAGLIEECCKGFILQYCMKLYLPHPKFMTFADTEPIVWLGLAVGAGFGTMEGVLYTCLQGGGTSFVSQLIIWLVRDFVAIPFHSIMGLMWGCEMAKRDALKLHQISLNLNQNVSNPNENEINQMELMEQGGNNSNMSNINNNNNNNEMSVRRHGCCMEWIKLGIKQVLWHGCYDFIEMEFSLLTASNNSTFEIEMAVVGCVIAIFITVAAGIVTRRTYRRLVGRAGSELIPDEPDDRM